MARRPWSARSSRRCGSPSTCGPTTATVHGCVTRTDRRSQPPKASMPTLRLDDAELHYEVFGDGPPFLFMSQTATSGGYWKAFQVPEFARDHRVIVYDQRGTGRSPTRAADFSTQRLAQDA